MPTTAEYKNMAKAGLNDPNGVLAANLDGIWDSYEGQADNTRRWLTRIDLIDLRMSELAEDVDLQDADQSKAYSQAVKGLNVLRSAAERSLAHAETATEESTQGPKVGQLVQTAPVMSPSGYPDANSINYRGRPNGWRP